MQINVIIEKRNVKVTAVFLETKEINKWLSHKHKDVKVIAIRKRDIKVNDCHTFKLKLEKIFN